MRRWNGWEDDSIVYPLPAGAARFLEKRVGQGASGPETPLAILAGQAPPSRLPAHPMISREAPERLRHARGQSLPDWIEMRYGCLRTFPDGVAFPSSGQEVRELIDFAQAAGSQVIPYGGGTSVAGHINPLPGEAPVLCIDLSRMKRLLRLNEDSRLATFAAGVPGPDLEAQLRAHGYTLGHYPQSFEFSTLGGWVATRSTGQQSLGYGRIERLFAGGMLETPAGAFELPSFPASAAGPDLKELALGSEGRMGILTEVTVRISRLPQKEEFHAAFFPDFERGLSAVKQILWAGLPLSMLRLSTAQETETTLALAGHERLIGALEQLLAVRGLGKEKCMLLLGYTGREALVKIIRKESLDLASKHGGVHVGRTFGSQWHKSRFHTPYLRNTLWEMGYAIDTVETACDWDHVPAMIEAVNIALHSALQEAGEQVHVFTHLSHVYPYGSSVYTTFLFRLESDPEETLRRWQALKKAASLAIVANHGTISHQHGVGLDHLPYLAVEKGPLGIAALGDVFRRFDPHGMMNPGKLVP